MTSTTALNRSANTVSAADSAENAGSTICLNDSCSNDVTAVLFTTSTASSSTFRIPAIVSDSCSVIATRPLADSKYFKPALIVLLYSPYFKSKIIESSNKPISLSQSD